MTTEDLLTRSLHEVTEQTHYPATPLATVTRRAGAVRGRRRRTTALAAAAAVAVVVAPAAFWLNRSPDSSSEPTVSPTTSSSPTTSPLLPTGLADLPLGHKPGIDYLDDDTYVGMGGGNVTEPLLRKVTAVALTRGGLVVALRSTLPNGALGDLQLLTDQGDHGPGCGANRFAISADRVETAYWVMDSCTTGSAGKLYSGVNNTMGESGPSYVATPAGRVAQPVGFVRQGVVVNLTMANGDAKEVWVYGPLGGPTQVPGLSSAGGTDQSDDLVAGQVAGEPGTGIIVHASTGVPVSHVPSWTLGQFSPDGKYVLGYQPGDGLGADRYAVFDVATGRQVTKLGPFGPGGLGIRQIAWDADDTVLAVAQDGRSSDDAIVRCDLHGHATLATEPKPAADPSFPVYRLATRP